MSAFLTQTPSSNDRRRSGTCGGWAVAVIVAIVLKGPLVPVSELSAQETVVRAVPVPPDGSQPPQAGGPEQDLFDFASMLFSQEDHAAASAKFEEYLQAYPQGRHRQVVMFRLGSSYLRLRQQDQAEQIFARLVREYPTGNDTGAAAYILAALRYNRSEYEAALPFFRQAVDNLDEGERFNNSLLFLGRTLERMGRPREAIEPLKRVAAITTDNPNRAGAMQTLGALQIETEDFEGALETFQALAPIATDLAMRAEAMTKAGLVLDRLDRVDEAVAQFERVLDLPADEQSSTWKGFALVSLLQTYYGRGDFRSVVNAYNRAATSVPQDDNWARVMLVVANANRSLKQYTAAIDFYLLIERHRAASDEALEAGYWKLFCFYTLGDDQLPNFTQAFLEKYSQSHSDHRYLSLARLILAQYHFNKQQYAAAAEAFARVDIDQVPEAIRESSLFNKAWTETQGGAPFAAVDSWTRFLDRYPESASIAEAHAQRGVAYKLLGEFDRAVADLEHVVSEHADHPAAEMAWQQLGIVQFERRDLRGMVTAFRGLLENFPESIAAAEAHYWIGWAHFEMREFRESTGPLARAIELDGRSYREKSLPKLVLANYYLQNVEELARMIDRYLDEVPNAVVHQNVLSWLGLKFSEARDPAKASRYLTLASTPDSPRDTPAIVWRALAEARLEASDYEGSVAAIEHYLAAVEGRSDRARGFLTKSKAQMLLDRLDEAEGSVASGLELQNEGRVNAQLRVVQGDVARARARIASGEGRHEDARALLREAAGRYFIVSQIWLDDPEVTPEALEKAAVTFTELGQADQAESMLELLRERFPNHQLRRNMTEIGS